MNVFILGPDFFECDFSLETSMKANKLFDSLEAKSQEPPGFFPRFLHNICHVDKIWICFNQWMNYTLMAFVKASLQLENLFP